MCNFSLLHIFLTLACTSVLFVHFYNNYDAQLSNHFFFFYYSPLFYAFPDFFLSFIFSPSIPSLVSQNSRKTPVKKVFYKNTFQTSASKLTKTKVVTRFLQEIRFAIHDLHNVVVDHICSVSFF